MADRQILRLLVPDPVRRLPADLAAVILTTAVTLGTFFLPVVRETPLRIVLGLPFALFLPGYALIAALFPEAGDLPDEGTNAGARDPAAAAVRDRGIDGIERVVLSFGLSIVVVPLFGIALHFTPWGVQLVPIATSIAVVTVTAAVIAAVRRRRLPSEGRFRVPYCEWAATVREELFAPSSRADAALNVLLVVGVLLAAGSATYAVAVPPDGEQFTELYLLTENDDGELVAGGYPQEFVRGESQSVVVGIGNHERERTEYSVVVQLQRVETVDNKTHVIERQRIDRFETRLDHNKTWHREHAITPEMTGENLRVQYLLYRGEPPASLTAGDAYRTVDLQINVEEPESDAADGQ